MSHSKAAMSAPNKPFAKEEQRVLELCEQFKQGITKETVMMDMPHLEKDAIVQIFNTLFSKNKLVLHQKPDKSLLYKLKDPVRQYKLKGHNREDQMVYDIIERSGSVGIWNRDIRIAVNLHQNLVDRALKRLENKKHIKSINSVQASKKKMYLVSSVEPDCSLTGGAFYTDNQFDSAFVDVLLDICFKYLENKLKKAEQRRIQGSAEGSPLAAINAAKVTAKEMQEYIHSTDLTKIKLSVEDVEKLLDSLVLDGRVKRYNTSIGSATTTAIKTEVLDDDASSSSSGGGYDCGGTASVKLWRALPDWAPTPKLLSVPCGVCPLINRCSISGIITPKTCVYLSDWLLDMVAPVEATEGTNRSSQDDI